MKLTVIGCAGSFAGPDSPASCYLVEAPHDGGTYRLLIDLGSGAFGPLQRHSTIRDIDAIALSHLHADHCFDMSGFYVVSRYHPQGAFDRIPVHAPEGAGDFLVAAYGEEERSGMSEQFAFSPWQDGATVQLGPFSVTSVLVNHPVPALALGLPTPEPPHPPSGATGPRAPRVRHVDR
ncbi:MAG: MBL fold metallo-hydrolase, partial [Aeromicrobium sp.]